MDKMYNKKYIMGRPNLLRNPVHVNIILEKDRMNEYKELLRERGFNLSEGIRKLIETQLQKNVEGSEIPILSNGQTEYNQVEQKPFECGLLLWYEHITKIDSQQELNIIKGQAVTLSKKVDLRSMELYKQGIKK
jgi:hypothetical protein